MPIQFTTLGFEPTIFGTCISSRNHYTRAPALKQDWGCRSATDRQSEINQSVLINSR